MIFLKLFSKILPLLSLTHGLYRSSLVFSSISCDFFIISVMFFNKFSRFGSLTFLYLISSTLLSKLYFIDFESNDDRSLIIYLFDSYALTTDY